MNYTITDIKKGKKDSLITLNDDFLILITNNSASKLNVGEEVSLISIVDEGRDYLHEKAMNLSYNYLSYSMRTKREVKKYLYDKHFHSSIVNEVLLKLEDYKFIDDRNYIKVFTRNKTNALNGKNKIKTVLIKKGIDKDLIEEVFEEIFTPEREMEMTINFVEKNKNKYGNCFYKEKADKLLASGLRKGYSSSFIISAIREVVEDTPVDNEKVKIKIEKKAKQILKKETDLHKARYKLFSYFYAKGADEEIINSVWEDIIEKRSN